MKYEELEKSAVGFKKEYLEADNSVKVKTEYSKGREAEKIETETIFKKLQKENIKENVTLKLKLNGLVWMPKDQEEEAKDLNEDE